MAGKGFRTRNLGEFKPFIEIKKHTILSWFISSIRKSIKENDTFVLITSDYFKQKYNFEEKINEIFNFHKLNNNREFVYTTSFTNGQSVSILFAKDKISQNKSIIVINPDQYIDFDLPIKIKHNTGYIVTYLNYGNQSGYVEIKNGLVKKFVEKENISNIASAGVLVLCNGNALVEAIENQLTRRITTKGEYYLGSSFNYLINKKFKIFPIPIRSKYDLGSIDGIEAFMKSSISINQNSYII